MKDIRICFLGDSFVNGTGDEEALGWTGRLCADARKKGHEVTCYNLGVRRNTSRDVLLRWQSEVALRLPGEVDGRIVLSCGVNDTVIERGIPRVPLMESIENVRELLLGAESFPRILIGPPCVGEDRQNRRIQELSSAYAALAADLQIPFIDLFAVFRDDEAFIQEISANDGFHPGAVGYSKMADRILQSSHWWF
ncbi:GDSL-type esterase/lipase family protein [Thiomicrorhabdus sp.]|uniref:GDSL-type esterase/lipase family protein n=1 Tax=Thiomicrorhabdus sp. TaxID=2039724 RepID=UPI0029C79849|nr:GDSL-type esterase/lipase family protein [Thiomicrorhabdus sp.]